MGGSTSKRSLLQKHGQLLTEEEKEAIFSCFIAITSDQEAEGFSVDQLAVSVLTVSKGWLRWIIILSIHYIHIFYSIHYSHTYRQ